METKYNNYEYHESLSKPYAAIISLTNDCTNACPYCFVRFNKQRMAYSTAEQAVQYITENAAFHGRKPSITFFGGEPLMEFKTIIEPLVLAHPEVSFSITTNGALLKPEVVDFFAEHGIPVLLSIDGPKEIQDAQRPLTNPDISSFDNLAALLPYATKQLGDDIVARSTITKLSIGNLISTYDTFAALGFKRFAFAVNAFETFTAEEAAAFHTEFHTLSERISLELLQRRYSMVLANLGTMATAIKAQLYAENAIDNRLERCGLATTGCGIAVDGTIRGCQEKNSDPSRSIGNVWTGIKADLHKPELQNWIDLNYSCSAECPAVLKRICLNDLCPSRIEDLALTGPASGTCMLNKAMFNDGNRFFNLFHNTTDEFIRTQYLGYQQEVCL